MTDELASMIDAPDRAKTKGSKLTVRCKAWRPFDPPKNTLLGMAVIYVAELKLTIRDVAVHRKGDRWWAQLPAKPQIKDGKVVADASGKAQWVTILEFDSRPVSDAFSAAVVRAVGDFTSADARGAP